MKRFLYLTICLVTILPLLTNGGRALGQNMATESYNPNSPWNQADETGYFCMERCPICDEFVVSYDENSVYANMENHILTMHTELVGDDGDTLVNSGEESGGAPSNNSGDPNNVNYTSVVNLSDVANALDLLGIFNANWFLEDYDIYCGLYIDENVVSPAHLNQFIRTRYQLRTNVDLKGAIDNGYPFLMLSEPSPSSGCYYINGINCQFLDVIHNYNIYQFNSFNYNYLYIFRD